MSLDSLNPYPAWRQGQREACQAIVEAVMDGVQIITYKGPTGSGKSLVLSVAARALLEEGGIKRATYTTPQRQLVHQLAGDERLEITALLGRANYPCHKMPQGSAGDCPVPAKARRKTCPRCPYLAARDAYVEAAVGATTLDKLLTDRSLPPAELLIVDESQGLEMKLIDQRAAILPEWMDLAGDLPEQMDIWLAAIRTKQLKYEGRLEKLFARLAPPGESEDVKSLMGYVEAEDAAKVARSLERINRALDKALAISRIVSEAPESYVIDGKTRAFKLISGREQFREFIMGTSSVILASGTPTTQLIAEDYITISSPHPVPVEQRMVYFHPCGKMAMGARDETLEKMGPMIAKMHKAHGQNTLCHCHSYKIAGDLGQILYDEGCSPMFTDRECREDGVEKWKASTGRILLSVGMEEGLDLPGPKNCLNIIVKVPFQYLGDEWIVRRNEHDKYLPIEQRYSDVATITALQQACGRIVRGQDDLGPNGKPKECWILDSSLEGLYKRCWQLFQPWFRESLCRKA